jgi:hypothetical protein
MSIVFLLSLSIACSTHSMQVPSPQQILDSIVLSRDDLKIELVVSEPALADLIRFLYDPPGWAPTD